MRIPAIGAVAQPVVDHELDPSRNKHIEMRDRYEIAPRQQPLADQAWASPSLSDLADYTRRGVFWRN